MQAFSLPELEQQRRVARRPGLEFLRVPALSMGLHELPAGGVDLRLLVFFAPAENSRSAA